MSQESAVRVTTITNIQHHPNADALDIGMVDGGYPVIVKRGEYKEGDTVVYVPVDTMVPLGGEFAWLNPKKASGEHRVRAKRLRDIFSMGLVLPAQPGDTVGDIVGERYGMSKYVEPDEDGPNMLSGNAVKAPRAVSFSKYDIEGWRKYGAKVFRDPKEEVVVMEKLHGANSRFMIARNADGESVLFCGSRTQWKAFDDTNAWGLVAQKYGLEAACRDLGENVVLFGEVLGVQDLRYGFTPTNPGFRVFEIYDANTRRYWDWNSVVEFCDKHSLMTAPILYEGPLSGVFTPIPLSRWAWLHDAAKKLYKVSPRIATAIQGWVKAKNDAMRALPRATPPTPLETLAEGTTLVGDVPHVREGVVIRPKVYRNDRSLGGRVILKLHGEGYLTRK